MSAAAKKGGVPVRLYRFFNFAKDKDGEPFALCDVCVERQPVPRECILNRIADGAVQPCQKCGAKG